MFKAMKVGCPMTPMKQSVVAKHASAILDLVCNLDFVFTAIMTSPFNKLFQSIPLNSKLSDLIEFAWG